MRNRKPVNPEAAYTKAKKMKSNTVHMLDCLAYLKELLLFSHSVV